MSGQLQYLGPAPNPEADTERWYAVRVKPRFEWTASAALLQKGFAEFLPKYRDRRRWSDRVKELDLPLFPGYLFCRFRVSSIYQVLNSPGVVHHVSAGGRPIPVDDNEIEALRVVCSSNLATMPWPWVSAGQRIIVARGPLKGIEGTVIRIKDHYRLIVSISLLQRSVLTELDGDWITPAAITPVADGMPGIRVTPDGTKD